MWDPRPGGRRVLLLRPQNQRRPECVRRSLLSLPTAYLGESQVATGLEAIQDRYAEIDIGSYPFMDDDGYGTTLVIRGTDPVALDKVLDEIKQLTSLVESPSSGGGGRRFKSGHSDQCGGTSP